MRAAVLALALALACKQEPARTAAGSAAPKDGTAVLDAARPAAVTDDVLALLDKILVAYAPIVGELHAAKSDCPKVVAIARSHHDRIAMLANDAAPLARLLDSDPAAANWIYSHIVVRWNVMFDQLTAVYSACQGEPGFAEAMTVAPMLERPDP